MSRNIIIFSDGTGQAGGLTPDQEISNVYKLYRATRCDTDSTVDPNKQIAFYDAGLGTDPEGMNTFVRLYRRARNVAARALGLGVNQNIIDCYAAIVRTWRPGDRIYLIGFSRGAFTVRCVGGVLARCGAPTTAPGEKGLLRDRNTALKIAAEAVAIYQHGSRERSVSSDPKKAERDSMAAAFRAKYGSQSLEPGKETNAAPYFIGVFDTVATISDLGSFWVVGAPILTMLVSIAVLAWFPFVHPMSGIAVVAFILSSVALIVGGTALYQARYGKDGEKNWRARLGDVASALKPFKFYNTELHKDVEFARHAVAIDENRDDFRVVLWDETAETNVMDGDCKRLRQYWFAGVHSDIGGSYPEVESRLSDIALDWMTKELKDLPHPPLFAEGRLNIFPSHCGMQHDEFKAVKGWIFGPRTNVAAKGTGKVHDTVLQRVKEKDGVLHYDEVKQYRPIGLKNHGIFDIYFKTVDDAGRAVDGKAP